MFQKVAVRSLISLFIVTAAYAKVPEGFIKTWLLCGPFPNPPNKEAELGKEHIYDHTPPCVGLGTDYLKEHGGEASIVPVAGMAHTKADGTRAEWFEHTSPLDRVVFRKAITKKSNVVGYAYTTVEADEPGSYLLALGSDEGVCVWVNGEKVHYNLIERRINADDDLVPVTFKKGQNSILMKVEQGWGGWGFILRIIKDHEVLPSIETDTHRMRVTVNLKKRAVEKPERVTLVCNGRTVSEGVFPAEAEGGLAHVTLHVPFPALGEEYNLLQVMVEGRDSGSAEVPSLDKMRAEEFRWHTPRGYPGCVFSGSELPRIDFEKPHWIEQLIGPYEVSTTYYDANHNEVSSATEPGRYGAVVDITTPTRTTRRFVTLYRQEKDVDWWHYELDADLQLPQELGVSDSVARDYAEHVSGFLKNQLAEGLRRDHGGAILLAALREAEADGKKADYYTSPWMRDRAWWLPLKRKLYGSNKKYPDPFICPRKIEGSPARVVRKGSLRDAGFKKDFPKRLDRHLKAWAADTDEAFAVIVVRHGVIAFHKAYGERDGKRMTLETKSWMASTTKMMSGSLIMMLVDQGLLNLDDRADKHLPPLRDAAKPWPATIRNLYRHTAGMDGHWGSWFSDMEYRVADLAPHYEYRARYNYDGAGLDLSCKILELISGETLPQFFQNHLLQPLGCEHTDVNNASGSANSVPLDMAKIGQMLLQKGAYGDMRFFSEETFEQMLPQPFAKEIENPPWDGYYGIGTGFFKGEGLGEGTFAHGAASSAYTRIDPVNDMVIIMTRNSRGTNHGKYSKGFFEIIVESLIDEEDKQ